MALSPAVSPEFWRGAQNCPRSHSTLSRPALAAIQFAAWKWNQAVFRPRLSLKESDLTPRAFVGQPLPVAGVLDGRRRDCPAIQMTPGNYKTIARTFLPSRGLKPRDLPLGRSSRKFVAVRPNVRSFTAFAVQDNDAMDGESAGRMRSPLTTTSRIIEIPNQYGSSR